MDYLSDPGRVCYDSRVGLVLGSHVCCSSIRWSGLLPSATVAPESGLRPPRHLQWPLTSWYVCTLSCSSIPPNPTYSSLSFSSFPFLISAVSKFPLCAIKLSDGYTSTMLLVLTFFLGRNPSLFFLLSGLASSCCVG